MCTAPQKATLTLVSLWRQRRLGCVWPGGWGGGWEEWDHESFESPQDWSCLWGHGRQEKLRKARQEEGAVAVARTEKANREFSAVYRLLDTIKGTFIFIFWRFMFSLVRYRVEEHWSRMGTNSGVGLVRGTVSYAGTPQSKTEARQLFAVLLE